MNMKSVIKSVIPHGVVVAVGRRSQSSRRQRIASLSQTLAKTIEPYSYRASIDFLCARGLPKGYVVGGSMPEASLAFCAQHLGELLPSDGPLVGLHVGNFLGVSLAYFADFAKRRNSSSVVFSIDPNLTHCGIERPQDHVIAVLNHFGLQKNAMISVSYSGEKSVSNDGKEFAGYDPLASHASEQACESALSNLGVLWPQRFDFAVLDGNHDASYLSKEADAAHDLLSLGGVLIFDDVDDNWPDIKAEFARLASRGWRQADADGRVGMLVKE